MERISTNSASNVIDFLYRKNQQNSGTTCKQALNMKNYKLFDGSVYCTTHTPKVASTAVKSSPSPAVERPTQTTQAATKTADKPKTAAVSPNSNCTNDFSPIC